MSRVRVDARDARPKASTRDSALTCLRILRLLFDPRLNVIFRLCAMVTVPREGFPSTCITRYGGYISWACPPPATDDAADPDLTLASRGDGAHLRAPIRPQLQLIAQLGSSHGQLNGNVVAYL